MSVIALAILVVGGYMAFKFIGYNLEKKQIKKEVFDTLGSTRGADRSNEELMDLIESVLRKKKVEILEVYAELDRATSVIQYSFKYRIVTDYLLFKRREIVEVVDQIENYG
ncbi:MAG: hypothetical protein JXO51_08350 [Candidatus Aminicenantes bacterium]|nr:hypothetical protein [Candidatus Aminicenantes bacterium]